MDKNKPKAAVLMTCFNRKEYTLNCLKSIAEGNPSMEFVFIITDDNSKDGTKEALEELPYEIVLLSGDGTLFWNGGMRKSFSYALEMKEKVDCYILVNDDVDFFPETITHMYERMQKQERPTVVTGAMVSKEQIMEVANDQDIARIKQTFETYAPKLKEAMTYGGIQKDSTFFVKYHLVQPSAEAKLCDSFNGNCVMIPKDVFYAIGNLDEHYIHSMSDFDYGFSIRRAGFDIINTREYTGICSDNDIKKSWRNKELSRKERLKLKKSPKGLPSKDWFYFVKKNYGTLSAIYHSLTPYVRILIGK